MAGLVFYDEPNGSMVLKSTIKKSKKDIIKLKTFDKNVFAWLETLTSLDISTPELWHSNYATNETLVRVTATILEPDIPLPKKKSWLNDIQSFKEFVFKTTADKTSYFFEYKKPPLPFFSQKYLSLGIIRMKNILESLYKEVGSNFEGPEIFTVMETDEVKILDNPNTKTLYVLFKLQETEESCCLKVKAWKHHFTHFELKTKENSWFCIATRYHGGGTFGISLTRFPEWKLEKAYEYLVDGSTSTNLGSITVNLKIPDKC